MKRSEGKRRRGWRERWSETDAREFLGRWHESGKLLPAYCREQGIGYERLRRWHAKLERESVSPSRARSIRLHPVRIVPDLAPASEANATMEIRLRGARGVRVDPGFDAEELVRLLGVLEQA